MPTMATAHLVRVAVVILCWETFATAHVTKYTVEYHKYPLEVQLDETRQTAMVTPPDTAGFLKYKTLHDYNTKITAYKDLEKSLCYLERIKDTDGRIKHQMRQFRPQRQSYRMRDKPRTMYVSDKNLSKYEVPSRHLPGNTEENHEKPVRIVGLRAEI
ncbi:hypothetical protein L798_08220 [Zootermopsis nevadensis]|uniref:BRICHOS domain-containing protein n=1 Tax=Zootermopsis nevadensis TaxID=136037 RepID=A0A067RD88_ZOONE|nr:hypothetical protein L798_08220 [Zootermopsis nevadensis]